MEIRPLPPDEAAVRRYVEALWLPYHRELEATVDRHALAGDVELVAEEVQYRLGRLESERHRTWVAVDGPRDGAVTGDVDLADAEGELAGFVATDVDESPTVFDRPDRLLVGDLYVREPYRGTGLGRDLVGRAEERARAAGCAALALDVDVDNERAIAFYEEMGFETCRRRMQLALDDR